MEETITYQVKQYKGVTESVAAQYGYRGVKLYKFALQLKSLFPYSYAYQLDTQISFIARVLKLDRRTIKKRIKSLIELRFAYMEGKTLRILSDTYIKKAFAKRNRHKHTYNLIGLQEIDIQVTLQPISENIKSQKTVQAMKQREVSSKQADCKSTFRELIKEQPNAKQRIVDTTLLSQQKAAKLLGYRSNTSGYRQLKRLAMAGCLELESNKVELTREEFNRYKECHMPRLLILGRGINAKYYYLVTNTVNLIKPKTEQVKEKGTPYYLNDNW